MIIDTHCHYNLPPLLSDWKSHWQHAQEHTVVASLVVGTSNEASHKALEIAAEVPALAAAVGIHPHEASHFTTEMITAAVEVLHSLAKHEKVVAIGECGLDYFRFAADEDVSTVKSLQHHLLKEQLKIAESAQLPVLIHLRDTGEDAYWDFLSLYQQTVSKKIPFVLHCVSGPLNFIKQCVDLGGYIGVAGNVTYHNSDHIRSIVAMTPKDRILVETDAPFLPPLPHRGKTCEPWMIQLTEEYVRKFSSLTTEQLLENTATLFPYFRDYL